MLPRFAVNRPVTVLMATLAVSTFGLLAVQNLPVDLLPDLSYPTLTIQTEYLDAAPETVEQFVTRPIEEAVGVIPGVREMRSQSRSSLSEVVLEFEWGESMDTAGLDVRERLGLVELPREAEIPRVLRFDPSLEPIMRLGFHGDRDLDELRQLADRWLKPRLEAVVGVAAAKVRGGLDAEIVVEADEDRLAALGLTPADLAVALWQENVNQPGGTLRDFNAIYLVRTMHEFEDLEQIRRTVVRETSTGRVRVEDVARVFRGHRDRDEISRLGGREVVELDLHRQGTANTVAVARAVQERLEELREEMPADLHIETLTDLSAYITAAIQMVWSAAWIGGLLAILVLFFFLRDLRATAIIALTIPISVVATFLFMSRAGVSLNIMSLGGLALGIGMLVDNSIVVLEAIDRRRAEGLARAQAAIKGAGEVAGAVTAATLTTVAVFFPIVFVQGVAGQLFRDQAITVCLSLTTSLLVSLTLIPALSGFTARTGFESATRFAGRRRSDNQPLPFTFRLASFELEPIGNGRSLMSRAATIATFPVRLLLLLAMLAVGGAWWTFSRVFQFVAAPLGRVLDGVGRSYPGTLTEALRRRWIVLAIAVAVFAASVMVIPRLGTDLVPDLAQGEFAFQLRLPEGSTLEATAETVDRIEAMLVDDPAFASVFSMVGSLPSAASGRRTLGENLAQINFRMTAGTDADDEATAVTRVRTAIARFPRAEAELVRPAVLSVRPPIAVQIFSDNLIELDQAAETVRKALENLSEVRDVATTSEPGNPEILVELDRERAAVLGVSAEDVGTAMRTKIRGDVVGEFREGEERIDIRLRAGERFRSLASGVQALRIILPGGTTVPVSAVAEVVTGRGPAAIYRYSGARVAEVTALPTTRDLGGALTAVDAAVSRLELPVGARTELSGQNEELSVSFKSLWLAMALATFLVYVVMASQFESLVHPFVILMAVPLGAVGVVAALVLTSNSVSVLVLIGAIMLAGIVVNNAIVLVDAVNRRRREGQGIDEALVGAGRERLRPILMTTATTVLALFPMALGLGAGDELRAPLAITVIGGLTVATLLTLIVIPCIYRIPDFGYGASSSPTFISTWRTDRKSEFGIRNSDQASSEGGGLEPPAGDGATRRPEADSKSEIRNWIRLMRLTDIPLDRPVATLMLLLSLTVLGTVAVFMLPLDFMPIINEPEIDIEIPFPGAHPLEALREVVEPIEEEIATIPDVRRILANTSAGQANMEVMFDWGVDVDIKKMEVREAVDRARPELPDTIGHISIRGDTDGGSSQVLAGRISAERNLSESWDLLDRRIGRPLERIKGVARVDLYGVEEQQVRIDLDLDALRRHGIDASEVLSTVNAANQDVDAGVIRGDVVRYEVRTLTRFQSADEIAALRLGSDGLRVADVAVVEMREPRLDYGRHLDRSFAVGIDVYKEPSANTVEVVDKALDRIDEIKADPQLEGINLLIWENQGEAIRNSLSGLRNAGIYGGIMAVAVLHFFLRRFRTTLIVATAIPFSLLVTCGAMYALGSQFNVLTLLGLMLGVGMLVDNAVVVIENIHRYEGMGNPAPLAARLGARQVALAVVASTATSIFVWSWLFVSERNTMVIMMGEVALTICLAVACSLLISLTFIPLAAARFAPAENPRPGIVVRKVVPAYRRLLDWTLDHRLLTLICLFVIAGSAAWPLMKIEKSGDMPIQTRQATIFLRVHDDTTKDVLESYVDQVEEWVFSRKEELGFDSVYSWYTEHGFCMTRVYLPEDKANPESIERLRAQLRVGLPEIAGVKLEVGDRDNWWRHGGDQDRRMVSVSLHGEDPEYLEELSMEVEERMRGLDHLEEVWGPTMRGTKELRLMVDADAAHSLEVSPRGIAEAVGFSFRGRRLRRFQGPNGEVEMVLGLPEEAQPGIDALADLPVPNRSGGYVPLSSVAEVTVARTPERIQRENRQTTQRVTAQFDKDAVTTDEAQKLVEDRMAGFTVPEGYSWDFGQWGHDRDEALGTMFRGVVLSLVAVILLMAALFESFTQPFAILITLMLAFFGAFWSLWLGGFDLNPIAFMGIIILIGIVVNNGIVLVDHVNSLRVSGVERRQALIEGCGDRLRPVVMTAITTIFGLIPLVVARATVAGAYIDSIAVAVIGGLATSTFFTLLALPVWYTALEDIGAAALQLLPYRRSVRQAELAKRSVLSG